MNYSNLIQYDCANGEGWRTTLFVSGCDFHCKGCFNPEAQDFNYGKPFISDTCNNILNMIKDDKISGLSIIGGDPMCQDYPGLIALTNLCISVHNLGKTVWLWSGFTFEEILDGSNDMFALKNMARYVLLRNVDIFIDGPFIEELKDPSLKWRGSSNQRIIDVKQSLKQNKIVLWEQK